MGHGRRGRTEGKFRRQAAEGAKTRLLNIEDLQERLFAGERIGESEIPLDVARNLGIKRGEKIKLKPSARKRVIRETQQKQAERQLQGRLETKLSDLNQLESQLGIDVRASRESLRREVATALGRSAPARLAPLPAISTEQKTQIQGQLDLRQISEQLGINVAPVQNRGLDLQSLVQDIQQTGIREGLLETDVAEQARELGIQLGGGLPKKKAGIGQRLLEMISGVAKNVPSTAQEPNITNSVPAINEGDIITDPETGTQIQFVNGEFVEVE